MSKEALIAGHEIKKALLGEAIKTGTWKTKPDTLSVNQWSMQRKIGFQYTLKEKNFDELGVQYGGRTGESMRQLNHKFWDNIHGNFPPQLQTQYPRETIPDRKPLSQKSRERRFETHGGRRLRIKRAIEEQGIAEVRVKDIDDIAKTAQVTRQQLLASRPALEKLGISIDRVDASDANYADFAKRLRKEKDDEKLQEFLDSLSAGSLIYFLHKDSRRKTLTTASVIANKKGFHVYTKRVRIIAEAIKQAKIPIRPTAHLNKEGEILGYYYIVYAKHADRIAEALRNDPELQRFR